MPEPATARQIFSFGVFEVDVRAAQLRKHGVRIKLQGQPFEILLMLLERAGDVVPRDELCSRLWPNDVFVDFDQSVNKAMNKLREVLGDSAENPRFIETVPRRGYRFIAPVQGPEPTSAPEVAVPPTTPVVTPDTAVPQSAISFRRRSGGLILGGLVVAASCLIVYFRSSIPAPAARPKANERIVLAVLPFENLSGDPGQEYFSDGLTEEMTVALSRMQPAKLSVISRTSTMPYKDRKKRVDEIGRELAADYLLEGSVRREGKRVRITTQLIQARDQSHLWVQSYEQDVAGVLRVQREVAERVAQSLSLKLLAPQAAALHRLPTTSGAAHEAYLKGRFYWNKRTEDSLRKSLVFFQEAVREDPSYALGYVGIADSLNLLADYGALAPAESLPRAKTAAQKALQLDERLAEAHASLGWTLMVYDWDRSGSEREFRRALELDPNYASAHQWYAYLLRVVGRGDEALVEADRARQLEPLSLIINAVLGWHHYLARDYDTAIQQFARTVELEPNFARVHSYLGWTHLAKGNYKEGIAALQRANELSGSHARLAELGHAYAVAGDRQKAQRILTQLRNLAERQYVEPDLLARIYIGLGDRDRAFQWLKKAYSERSVKLVLLNVDPKFDPIRSDPRFVDLIRRVSLL